MKEYINIVDLVLIYSILFFASFATAQQVFYDALDYPQFRENASTIKKSPNDDLIMMGEVLESPNAQDQYYNIHRTDQNGNLQFNYKYYEASQNNYTWRELGVADFGILVTGNVSLQTHQYQQLVKLNPDGNVDWAKKYHHLGWEGEVLDDFYNEWYGITQYDEESFLLTGTVCFKRENQTKVYAHFAKVDLDGNIMESNLLDLTNHTDRWLQMIKIIKVGTDLIAIGSLENQGYRNLIIIKLDSHLQVGWAQDVVGGSISVIGHDIVAINNTEFIISGSHSDVFALKMDISGQTSWIYAYKWAAWNGFAGSIHLANNGDFYISGHAYVNKFFQGADWDLFLLKANSQGSLLDVKYFGKDGIDELSLSSVRTSSGLFIHFAETTQDSRVLLSGSYSLPFACGNSDAEVSIVPNEYAFTLLQVNQRPSYVYTESLEYENIPVEYDLESCGHIDYGEFRTPLYQPIAPALEPSYDDFNVFPNPSSDVTLLSWKDSPMNTVGKIKVLDFSGRTVYSEKVHDKTEIKYSFPDPGIYIILAFDQHNQILHRQKAIKL